MPKSVAAHAAKIGARLRRIGTDFDFVERADGWDYVGLGSRRRELPLPALAGSKPAWERCGCCSRCSRPTEPKLLVPDAAVSAGLAKRSAAGAIPGRRRRAGSGSWTSPTTRRPRSRLPRASRGARAADARLPSAGSWVTRTSRRSSPCSRSRSGAGSPSDSRVRARLRHPSLPGASSAPAAVPSLRPPTSRRAWPPRGPKRGRATVSSCSVRS